MLLNLVVSQEQVCCCDVSDFGCVLVGGRFFVMLLNLVVSQQRGRLSSFVISVKAISFIPINGKLYSM
jgi:hypothetical protein